MLFWVKMGLWWCVCFGLVLLVVRRGFGVMCGYSFHFSLVVMGVVLKCEMDVISNFYIQICGEMGELFL